MRVINLIARVLLGVEFLVFGLNGFLNFIPMPPPGGLAGEYMSVMFASHYMVLLLANRFEALALTLLAPVLVNILLFHSLLSPGGLPLALFTLVLWGVVFYGVRQAFAGLFQARVGA
jgi:putative oxidoreductase